MSTRILIVGSRRYPSPQAVVEYIMNLHQDTIVVSGGARGVDTWAERAAQLRGLHSECYPADWSKWGRSAGYRRNAEMVLSQPDRCVAFWDGTSRGTKHTIDLCQRHGIEVEIIYPPEP